MHDSLWLYMFLIIWYAYFELNQRIPCTYMYLILSYDQKEIDSPMQ